MHSRYCKQGSFQLKILFDVEPTKLAIWACRLHQYDYKSSFFGGEAPLSQKVGYPVVIGLAAFFTILTVTLVQIDRRWGGTK